MDHRHLTDLHCLPLIQFREHRPRHGLRDKELIDDWITVHQEDQFAGDVSYPERLTMADVGPDQVMVQVRCVTMPVRWSLFSPARKLPHSPALDAIARARVPPCRQPLVVHPGHHTAVLGPYSSCPQ